MKQFKDLNIKIDTTSFTGEKIMIDRVLNTPIIINDYKITNSKFKGECLYLQITYKNEQRVVFTGSKYLMETMLKVPKEAFPFETTIVKAEKRFNLT